MVENTTKQITSELKNNLPSSDIHVSKDGEVTVHVAESDIGQYFALANKMDWNDGRRSRVNGVLMARIKPVSDDRNSLDKLFSSQTR